MKLFRKKSSALLPKGPARARIGIISEATVGRKTDKPNVIQVGFEINGKTIACRYSRSIDHGSDLSKLIEMTLGRPLTDADCENGFDTDLLLDSQFIVVIDHGPGPGGKIVEKIISILSRADELPSSGPVPAITIAPDTSTPVAGVLLNTSPNPVAT